MVRKYEYNYYRKYVCIPFIPINQLYRGSREMILFELKKVIRK